MYIVFLLNILNTISNNANRVFLALLAVNLGTSPIMVGVLGAMFATFPALLAVVTGRLNDRLGSRQLFIIGAIISGLGMLVPAFWPVLAALMIAALASGLMNLFYNVCTQNLTGLLSTPENRTRNFSNYALSNSVAQFIGPLIAGLSIDHLGTAAACQLLAAVAATPLVVLVWRRKPLEPSHAASRNKEKKAAAASAGGAMAMLRNPAVRATLYTSSLLNVVQILFTFYMPVYMNSVGISASVIGVVMAVHATAAFVVRLWLPRLIQRWKEDKVLAVSFFLGASNIALIPFTHSPWVLGVLSFLLGIGLGMGGPIVTMQMFANSAEGRSGEGIGLKMTINHLTKLVGPVAFGAVASAFGLNPMFWLNALLLGAGGYFARSGRAAKTPGAPTG